MPNFYLSCVNDGKAARVKVETGQRRDGKVEILSGVGKNDVIVTAGQGRLRDGTLVRMPGVEAARDSPASAKPAPSLPKS